MFLSAALVVPIGAMAMPAPQDDRERHEQEEHQRRYYDQQNRDYHNWNNQEDRMYREWLSERHYNYVDYDRLDRRDQQATGNGAISRRSGNATRSTKSTSMTAGSWPTGCRAAEEPSSAACVLGYNARHACCAWSDQSRRDGT